MKYFLQNLLVVLAFALCGLCAWQWHVQTALHSGGAALQKALFARDSAIQGFTNSIKSMDAEIAGLSTRVNELKQTAAGHEQTILEQKHEINRLRLAADVSSNEISQYKAVVDQLEARLKEANAGIEKQNDAIKKLLSERDGAIQKLNDGMNERNALAEKYNDLVRRFNKLQADTSGTNAPAKPN
ncbi:MAG TPA: hypothetical protein VGO59_09060 [Verrucomicrobiae bacterium]|jgi:chromosome segregation ATPase